jgi:hypothetical protein
MAPDVVINMSMRHPVPQLTVQKSDDALFSLSMPVRKGLLVRFCMTLMRKVSKATRSPLSAFANISVKDGV